MYCLENLTAYGEKNINKITLEYRINGGGGENNRGGGVEIAQYDSNRGGWNNRGGLGEIENSRFLR